MATKEKASVMASTEVNKDSEVPSTKKQAQVKAVIEAQEFLSVHGENSLEALKNLEATFKLAFNELFNVKADYDAYHKAFATELGELSTLISDFVYGHMSAICESADALASLEQQGNDVTRMTKELRKRQSAVLQEVADLKDKETQTAIVTEWNKNGSTKNTISSIARDHGVEVRKAKPQTSDSVKFIKSFTKRFEGLSASGKGKVAKGIIKAFPDYFSTSVRTS